MTGRELIIYILENNLEEEDVFKDGRVLGFMTVSEAAVKFNVGVSTISIWVRLGVIPCIMIGGNVYIPANAVLKLESLQQGIPIS